MATGKVTRIVISAVNFTEGGPLSILRDCLRALALYKQANNIYVKVLVHQIALVPEYVDVFDLEEYPLIKSSWLKRVKFEYLESKGISVNFKPDVWLSLHDITPNIVCEKKYVYCHNPSPFYELTLKEVFLDPKFASFSLFYKYLYAINIKRNNYVIVQQQWLREKFEKLYNVNAIVAHPDVEVVRPEQIAAESRPVSNKFTIFFPSFPRIFKNFEVLFKAGEILSSSRTDFEIIVTISGLENSYADQLLKQYSKHKFIKFVGKLSRDEVFSYYQKVDCLIFPSKLETWGLPLTEFKTFNKPIISADLPYARETIGDYDKVKFFNPRNHHQLAANINLLIDGKLSFDVNDTTHPHSPFAANWNELFKLILN